jgi:hypothetical protein
MYVAHGEMVEKQLDALIQRRARKGDLDPDEAVEAELDRLIERGSRKGEVDHDEREEGWQESVRRFNEKRRQIARLERHAFHCGQAERHRRTLQELISFHETQAERLLTEG